MYGFPLSGKQHTHHRTGTIKERKMMMMMVGGVSYVTFSVHEFLIWCALIDSALPGTVCLSAPLHSRTHSPFFSLPSYLPFLILYLFIHLISQGSLRSLGRLRWMDWWRKSSQWCYPLCDLLHDTMSPKWQTWRRIKCFKVSQAEIKTQQAPLGWWTGFVAGKGRHVATMTPGLWFTGPTHVTSCSWRGKKGKESLILCSLSVLAVAKCRCLQHYTWTLQHNCAKMMNPCTDLSHFITIFCNTQIFRCLVPRLD